MATTILLKDIPPDVYTAVLKEQARLTLLRKSKVSLNITIIKILREFSKQQDEAKS